VVVQPNNCHIQCNKNPAIFLKEKTQYPKTTEKKIIHSLKDAEILFLISLPGPSQVAMIKGSWVMETLNDWRLQN